MAHTQTASLAAARPGRHRLRAVDPNEVAGPSPLPAAPPLSQLSQLARLSQVADFLPPGATLLPAPQHALPTLPGRPPMVGYLVLVPADQQVPVGAPVPASPVATEEQGPVAIDGVRRIAVVDGEALDLTYLEFELLAHLVAHPHRVHTRDQLVTTVWGYGHVGDGRTVDVHVARLRRKLGAEHRHTIQTVRRVGYKYTP
ncbi:winged helix-turn-helix domain-containing protein [Streptomyces sp. NBC_00094]|uniref:winged helix-turn-helix domain-containing protein n=1 Tax=Streptomyces sp. NBC_00094 TaxID=2903620 RepID=UPI00225065C4|nr:winged helix-turn-helix domain-containing protein [Streptomyces sp. NBC_00094]MCX5390288.1 winged helix-turn-helix domain-containing protein [Streptomyces sp. NBC_00094]